jgi:membrane protein
MADTDKNDLAPATLWSLGKRAASLWSDAGSETQGAAIAFYAIFSLGPLLLIGLAVTGWVLGPQAARGELHRPLHDALGATAAEAVEDVLVQISAPDGGGVTAVVVGAVLLLFTASGVFGGLHVALNAIWGARPARPGLLAMLHGRAMAFLMVLGSTLLLLAVLIAGSVLEVAAERVSTPIPGLDVWMWADRTVTLAVLTALFALAYKLLPAAAVAWRDVWVGALVTALLVALSKYLVGFYLSRAGVASAYGAAGSVVVLLLFFYLSAQVFLFGAAFTRAYAERHHRQEGGRAGLTPADGPTAQPRPAAGPAPDRTFPV